MIQRYAQLCFFVKGSGTSFKKKFFFHFYSIDCLNFIVWLPLFVEILGNMCIVIIYCPVCDVINCEVNLCFLSNCFPKWPKSRGKIVNIWRTERFFLHEIKKAFFINFKGLSVVRNSFRPESEWYQKCIS